MFTAFALGVFVAFVLFAIYLKKKAPSNEEIVRSNQEIINRSIELNAMAKREIIKAQMADHLRQIEEMYNAGEISPEDYRELSEPLLASISLNDLPEGIALSSDKK
ncbi:hypothetical protein BWI97_15695 [Siphonobacter sp. BAB-5405]|uniref:hypothetical protein n=1 Tax=Siphonobacter sp. BAB-5405 TaxID=1864825 RepID=UPI000C80D325|nr:hypothetical protein [Siphonobacter sp. BAB-5405]PMD94839.1 hypothetical protein BWI97_15695 [Siphonobacter sp. BAB-5405]